SAIELLRTPDIDRKFVESHIRILGDEKLQTCLETKKGFIFLTAHFGNWELVNVTAGILNYPIVVVARVQKHPRADRFLNDLRASKGSQVIHKGMPIREV